MSLVTGWATNKGSVREDNQDCCYVNVTENVLDSIGIAVICDGMGGLSDGAIASSMVCDDVRNWFNFEYSSNRYSKSCSEDEIIKQMSKLISNVNKKLVNYGIINKIKVGTTASIIFLKNNMYYIVHVGDSRIYKYSADLQQITEDDSVAARKMRNGEITKREYKNSTKKNVLTQCVGVNETLNIHQYKGTYKVGDVFFLCSDGMYHFLEEKELSNILMSQRKEKGSRITASIERTIDKLISRGEKDNITGVIVCVI